MNLHPMFPINKNAKTIFQFASDRITKDSLLFFLEYREYRLAAYKINNVRQDKDRYAKPSDLQAIALINKIYFHLFDLYQTQILPDFALQFSNLLKSQFSKEEQEKLISKISKVFPCETQLDSPQALSNFFIRSIVIRLNNMNPAMSEYVDLFSDSELREDANYQAFFSSINTFFEDLPSLDGSTNSLLAFLRAPFLKFPASLYDQLALIQSNWKRYLGGMLDDLLLALDFLKEEYKPVSTGFGGGAPQTTDFGLLNDEYEAFTDDKNWMPNVIMLAKSTLVWLDQLSQKYEAKISKLNEIPDKELDAIQKQGFTSIWLIGIWERSHASKRIKHIYGNFDAEASAYSLYDYTIAESLGGWEALQQLKIRCNARGIRLASDMVPNHTALDSRWMIEHPDRFLQLPYNPIPHYSFSGENLSGRDDIGIYLEDKYYSRSDCAVVFKRLNFKTGEERYIYHGNDGTGLPWNDTAQIDYLNPEAREAIIQTILHVAHNFSVIRFDAAMTLAKKHIQRLWYPAPGQGGDIATRTEFALSTAEFNRLLPQEFWREVVDRIAKEAPDTLLLAEAFWMLEGYFVRTLGMHRVYNSAFMHMLRDEKNAQYRYLIKETLEFDPQILKRYVNFMNNPDEETAAEQFGKDDKYFGICLLLCTLPGLPMIGHGQIEGFYEKYGMEFKKALWDEKPDEYLIKRHEKEIFPLLHQRALYSEVHNFRLYDFNDSNNNLNENVFAYSNFTETENSLVVYNNCYDSTFGSIQFAVPFKDKMADKQLNNSLYDFIYSVTSEPQDEDFILFTEVKSQLDYIRSAKELREKGLVCMLSGYEYQVFQNFRKVSDSDGSYAALHKDLNGSGIYDLAFEATVYTLRPFFDAAFSILSPQLFSLAHQSLEEEIKIDLSAFLAKQSAEFAKKAKKLETSLIPKKIQVAILSSIETALERTLQLLFTAREVKESYSSNVASFFLREETLYPQTFTLALAWASILAIKKIDPGYYQTLSLNELVKYIAKRYYDDPEEANELYRLVNLLQILDENKNELTLTLKNPTIIQQLNINKYNEVIWFNLEPTEVLLNLRLINQVLKTTIEGGSPNLEDYYQEYLQLHDSLIKAEYRLASFIETL